MNDIFTRERVRRKVLRVFSAEDPERVMEVLDLYGTETWERERERVQLGMLKLSAGDVDRLIEWVAVAKRDYLDVIACAESPAEMRTLPGVVNAMGSDAPPPDITIGVFSAGPGQVTGNSISGAGIGIAAFAGCTAAFRNNNLTGCTGAGVSVSGMPDFGTASSPGGNVFHCLASGADANLLSFSASPIRAVGNTWDHVPPTVDLTGTFPAGYDILGFPGGVVF